MVLGTLLGLAALGFLWWPRAQVLHLKVGALLSSLYWISQVPALFFPGTALKDPQLGLEMPTIFGMTLTQMHVDVVLLGLVLIGYALVTSRRAEGHSHRPLHAA